MTQDPLHRSLSSTHANSETTREDNMRFTLAIPPKPLVILLFWVTVLGGAWLLCT